MPLRRVLRDYLKRCLDMRADGDAVLADQEFERSGGTVHYAADFTEMFAYVYPLQAAERERFGLTEGEQRRVNLSDYVLDALFFGRRQPVVLLPPYQAELRGFGAELRTEQLDQFDRLQAAFASHAEKLRALPEFQEIARAARAGDRDGLEGLTGSLLLLLEEHAPTLLMLGRARSFMPIARLNRLLRTARFAALGDVLGGRLAVGDLDHDLIVRWQERLHEQRPSAPEAANVMDAIAVAYLKEANRRLAGRSRLLLVTRSRTMHRVFDAEIRERLWPGHAGSLLRRPQSFVERAACDADAEAAGEQLRHRQEGLRAFIRETQRTLESWPRPGGAAATSSSDPSTSAAPRPHDALAESAAPFWNHGELPPPAGGAWLQQLSELARQRETLENLIMAEWLTRQPDAASNAVAKQPDVAAVLALLQSDADLGEAISRRFLELAEEIDASHVLLAGDLARGDATARDQIVRDINLTAPARRGEGAGARPIVVLSSRVGTMPVTLQFYADALAALVRAGKPDDVALNEFLEGDEGSGYERTLARAFVMATLGRWTLARFHCDLALRGGSSGRHDPVPAHEAHYFRSVCRRFSGQRGPDAYRASLADLDEATAIKRRLRRDPGYEDPRYTNERAVVLHGWRTHAAAAGEPADPGAPESFVEAVTLWKRSLARIRDDKMLKLLILNNLCYHFVEHGRPSERHEALRYYKSLTRYVAELGRSEPELPCNVIDTLVWARWKLAGEAEADRDPERLASLLRIALADPYIPNNMRAVIEDHLAAVSGHKLSAAPTANAPRLGAAALAP